MCDRSSTKLYLTSGADTSSVSTFEAFLTHCSISSTIQETTYQKAPQTLIQTVTKSYSTPHTAHSPTNVNHLHQPTPNQQTNQHKRSSRRAYAQRHMPPKENRPTSSSLVPSLKQPQSKRKTPNEAVTEEVEAQQRQAATTLIHNSNKALRPHGTSPMKTTESKQDEGSEMSSNLM